MEPHTNVRLHTSRGGVNLGQEGRPKCQEIHKPWPVYLTYSIASRRMLKGCLNGGVIVSGGAAIPSLKRETSANRELLLALGNLPDRLSPRGELRRLGRYDLGATARVASRLTESLPDSHTVVGSLGTFPVQIGVGARAEKLRTTKNHMATYQTFRDRRAFNISSGLFEYLPEMRQLPVLFALASPFPSLLGIPCSLTSFGNCSQSNNSYIPRRTVQVAPALVRDIHVCQGPSVQMASLPGRNDGPGSGPSL